MLMALTDLDCSSRYHQSILKEYNHRKPIVFLPGSRLSSGCIFHTHHYLQPSQIRTFFRLMPRYRIGTFAPVPIRSLEVKQYSRYPGRLGKRSLFPLRCALRRRLSCWYTGHRLWICLKQFLGWNKRTGFFFPCCRWHSLFS